MTDMSIFEEVLDKLKSSKYLENVSEDDYSLLEYLNRSIDTTVLYKYPFHGVYHSEKVMLFSFLIGKELGLNETDMRILLDASRYHDIGRASENDKDTFHGYSSSHRIKLDSENITERDLERNEDNPEFMSKYNFYKNDEYNLTILRAIVDAHSLKDKERDNIFINYDLPESQRKRYELLYSILKDADALDRARFPKQSKAALQEAYLRNDFSKTLIDFAYEVNALFNDKICERRYDYYSIVSLDSTDEKACLHGIGWDFVKLESILQNGILSQYAASRENVEMARNHNGDNSNMWISVIDSEEINKGGTAYTKFVQKNISFYAFVPGYIKPKTVSSEAFSKGLPHFSGRYNDESFVFDKIPKENIYSFIIPNGMLDTPIKDLNFIDCALNSSILSEKTKSYYDYISSICEYSNPSDLEEVERLEQELEKYEIECTKVVMEDDSKFNIDEYKKTKDGYGKKINEHVSSWMDKAYRKYFGLKDDEQPTVRMVVDDILKRNNIKYSKMDGAETIYRVELEKGNVKQ